MLHALAQLWSRTPHVNHERTNHDYGHYAEDAFAQSFVGQELTRVSSGILAQDLL